MSAKLGGLKVAVVVMAAIALFALPLAVGAAEMANGITSPKAGASVSGSVDVTGYASAPAFWKWQLDLLPGGAEDAATFLAVGETPGEFSYALDTTSYPNGEHALRLRVVTTDGNYQEYTNKFTIANGAAQPARVQAAAPSKDIVATAVDAGQFKTLVAAVQAAGLVGTLQGAGPFTVFAPTDLAFSAVPTATLQSLLKDPKALSNVLLYHVLSGAVKAESVKDGLSVNTIQGSPVTFSVKNGKPMINDANIVSTDVMASNGVIHVIDKVILPPAAAAAPGAAAKPAMANGFTNPKDGATVSSAVEVKGNAGDPKFAKWQLDVLPGGDANAASFLALGETAGEFSVPIDTTAYPNGEHALRLRVVRTDGNYDEYINKFTIANAAGKAQVLAPGKYLRQGTQDRALQFNKDGTLIPLLLPDTQLAKATYTVKGDVYTETSNDQGCITNRNYKYTFDGTKLVFTPLEVYDPATDSCAGRAADFNPSVTWVMFK